MDTPNYESLLPCKYIKYTFRVDGLDFNERKDVYLGLSSLPGKAILSVFGLKLGGSEEGCQREALSVKELGVRGGGAAYVGVNNDKSELRMLYFSNGVGVCEGLISNQLISERYHSRGAFLGAVNGELAELIKEKGVLAIPGFIWSVREEDLSGVRGKKRLKEILASEGSLYSLESLLDGLDSNGEDNDEFLKMVNSYKCGFNPYFVNKIGRC